MQLLTPRLLLDALRAQDASALLASRAASRMARFPGWRPIDLHDVAAFIAAQNALAADTTDGSMQHAIRRRDSGELIGDGGLCLPARVEESVEFGITVASGGRTT